MKTLVRIEDNTPYRMSEHAEVLNFLTGLFMGSGLGMERSAQRAAETLAALPVDGDEVLENLPDGRLVALWTEGSR